MLVKKNIYVYVILYTKSDIDALIVDLNKLNFFFIVFWPR